MPTTTGRATDFITFTRTSNATVTDSNGFIKWAGHNLLTNSESFDASAWGKYLTTVTANSTAAPNGTTTADTIATTSSNATIYQTSSIPVGTSTFSCWFKAGTLTSVKVIFDGGAATGREATFTLSGSGTAGAVANSSGGAGTFSGGTSSITPLADGWYLCTIANVTTTAAGVLALLLATSGNVIAWGAHLYRSDLGGMVLNPARGDAYYPTTPRNLLGFTEDFSNAAWTKTNILAFGSGSISNAIVAPNGLQTADKIVSSTANNNHRVQWSVAGVLVSNTKYVFSFYAKAAEYTKVQIADAVYSVYSARFDLTGSGSVVASSGCTAAITSVGDGWYRCSAIYTSGGANAWAHISPYPDSGATFSVDGASYTGDGTSGIYLWGAQLSDSASLDAYSPVYGAAVTSAAYYAPRLDFDPVTLAARGLLVEESRTNLLLQSSDYDSWSKSNATVSVDVTATTAPDGTTTSDKIVATAVSGLHYVSRSASVTSSAVYTLTVYAKAALDYDPVTLEETDLSLGITDSPFPRVKFNLSNGTKTSEQGGATGTIASVGNGWYRCSCTFTAPSSSVNPAIIIRDLDTNWTGNGTGGLYAYGAQLELGSFPTSFIPTGASTATRTSDVASVSTQAFPYSASEGTLVASGLAFNFTAGSSTNCLAALSDGTTSNANYVYSFGNTPYSATTNGGNVQANITSGSALSPNTVFKLGYAIKANDFAFTSNGSSVGTDTSGSVPTANQLQLGRLGSAIILNGHIRQITYIPRRLTNAELVARST